MTVRFLAWVLFYSPSTHFRSFRARSVTLTTLFLGNLPVLSAHSVFSAHSFASNWQLLFLNQQRENGRRNCFMTKSPWKSVLYAKRTHFRSSYHAWLKCKDNYSNFLLCLKFFYYHFHRTNQILHRCHLCMEHLFHPLSYSLLVTWDHWRCNFVPVLPESTDPICKTDGLW